MTLDTYHIRFTANEQFAELLKQYARLRPDDIRILSEYVEEDAIRLGFRTGKALVLAVAVSTLLYNTAGFGDLISEWTTKSGSGKIKITTPYASCDFHSESITKEQVAMFLESCKNMVAKEQPKGAK